MENPDPRLYREAEVALQLADEASYRGFLSRGRIVGRLLRVLGGGEWDFRRPYLDRSEAERLRQDLAEMGVDASWERDVLVISDPKGRWRPARISSNRHGLYQVGRFGRAVRAGSGFERQWEEVVLLPHDRPLDAQAIASALDTERSLGPAFERIGEEVDVAVLIEVLPLVRTDYGRERMCVLLADHEAIVKAIAALPLLKGFLDARNDQLRDSAAYAIATIAGRAGPSRAKAADPELTRVLRERVSREQNDSVRTELEAALGAFGEPPSEPRKADAERFTGDVRRVLDFLKTEHGFEEPTVEDRWLSTSVTYRNEATAVVARADWRDSFVEVLIVELRDGAIPVYVDGVSNSLAPSWILDLTDGVKKPPMSADPRNSEETGRLLEREAEALRLCDDALRGDFTRFHRAVARLAGEH